jgi:hypothetical protein
VGSLEGVPEARRGARRHFGEVERKRLASSYFWDIYSARISRSATTTRAFTLDAKPSPFGRAENVAHIWLRADTGLGPVPKRGEPERGHTRDSKSMWPGRPGFVPEAHSAPLRRVVPHIPIPMFVGARCERRFSQVRQAPTNSARNRASTLQFTLAASMECPCNFATTRCYPMPHRARCPLHHFRLGSSPSICLGGDRAHDRLQSSLTWCMWE